MMKNIAKKLFSSEKRGIISLDKLKQKGFPDLYGRLSTVKVDPDHFINNFESGFTIDSSALHSDIDGISIGDPSLGNKKIFLKPNIEEIREMAWLKNKSYLIMGDVVDFESKPYAFSPRNILKDKVEDLKSLGYFVKGASELEFFLYSKKYSENYTKGLTRMKEFGSHAEDYLIQQGDRYEHIYEKFRTKLRDSGLSVEGMKGEASIGQHEINVGFGDAVAMSDSVLVLKTVKYH